MNTQHRIGPTLADLCPEFKAKIEEYTRAAIADPENADRLFHEAQRIAREFRMKEFGG